MKWLCVCGALVFVYVLWRIAEWTTKRDPIRETVADVTRRFHDRRRVFRSLPLKPGEREEGETYAYEKLLDDTEEIVQ
jgi:hypothetical protein